MMELIKIGDLARQTGLSIRTLRYYDEIGLLSPSHRTNAGHRLYESHDIMRLQQIVSLRQLGFSLAEVEECLANPEFSLPKVIDLHCTRVREQIELSRRLLKQLNRIAHELQTTQSVAVDNLIETMEAITMTTQYFTPEQQTTLEQRFQEIAADWQDMLSLARDVMSEGSALSSVKANALAGYWQQTMKSLIGGDVELFEALTKLYQQEGAEAASLGSLDAETFDYILKAVAFSTLNHEIQLHFSEQNYTSEAIRVIELGEAAVREIHLDVVGTEAILLGLLAEGTSAAAKLLRNEGVTSKSAQRKIVQLLGSRSAPSTDIPIPPQLPLVRRVKRVLELARDQAEQFGQSRITPDFLLLGILKETQEIETMGHQAGIAARVLREEYGLAIAHLEQQLLATISQGL